MQEVPKQIKRLVREWAGIANERELQQQRGPGDDDLEDRVRAERGKPAPACDPCAEREATH